MNRPVKDQRIFVDEKVYPCILVQVKEGCYGDGVWLRVTDMRIRKEVQGWEL